ncbi:hypothetical protein HPB47_014025 [Ixodes persulcatus]|uniref:Uncharacterized protein n=1 Tax=Ixodes persulcatus TaxID=34615 RepID=A0AC60QWZ2_IXOPE|nr:hypothetical protein HPB47_014025 [Ixodes persulcatus]
MPSTNQLYTNANQQKLPPTRKHTSRRPNPSPRILQWNCGGLQPKLPELKIRLQALKAVKLGDTVIDIHNTYIRPSVSSNEAAWIKGLVAMGRHTILAGDFNAQRPGKEHKKACVAAKLKLCNSPEVPTRLAQIPGHNDTSPDLTWASPKLKIQWKVQSDPMGSDHLPSFIQLSIRSSPRRRATFTKWDNYRTAIGRHNGVPLAERIQLALKEARTEYQVKEDTPPLDLRLVKLWEKRLKALVQYRARKSLTNKICLNQATAEAKRYMIELCRTTWRGMCDSFNDRTGYMKFFPQQPTPPPAEVYTLLPIINEQQGDAPFTMAELIDALSLAKANSAPGPDQVTITALRNLPMEAMNELLDTFNAVWVEGAMPAEWKRSTVIPIPKPGKTPHAIANLRPISLTSNLSKVLERMVTGRLQWILETTGALHPMQTGLRPQMSTQDSLVMIHHDLYERHLSNFQLRTLVAIDLRKAFDSIPHSTVVAAAQRRVIQGRPSNFIKTFLENCTYQVAIGNTKGCWKANNIGVPQGAVLSPLLFNLAMTDLALALEAVPQPDWHPTSNTTCNVPYNIVTTFAQNTGLELSKEKTMYMVIPAKRKKSRTDIHLHVEGTPITQADSVKILGVSFDHHGRANTWMTHVKKQNYQQSLGAQEDPLRRLARTLLV